MMRMLGRSLGMAVSFAEGPSSVARVGGRTEGLLHFDQFGETIGWGVVLSGVLGQPLEFGSKHVLAHEVLAVVLGDEMGCDFLAPPLLHQLTAKFY